MSTEPFVKRGVVEGETEETPVVTDSDQAVKAAAEVVDAQVPRSCCGRCKCGKSGQETSP